MSQPRHPGSLLPCKQRVGLFGGTFDPIHRGHLEVAEAARQRFGLDQICLVPAAQPPHKRALIATAVDRIAMVRLAVAHRPGFSVSTVELEREGPSYTIETILQVKSSRPPGAELVFLLGYDAFLELNTWKSYNSILQEVPLIVLARGRYGSQDVNRAIATLKHYIDRHLPAGYRWDAAGACFVHPEARTIHFFDGPRLDISATEIRRLIGKGMSARAVLPAAVADYIDRKGLYQ